MDDNRFPLDLVERYAPTATSVGQEWDASRQRDVLADIVGSTEGRDDVYSFPLQFDDELPARGRVGRYALAGSVAVIAAAAGVCLAVLPSGGSNDRESAAGTGSVFIPPAGLSDVALTDGQVSYRVDQQIDVDSSGAVVPNSPDAMVDRNWISANGDIRSVRTGSQNGCTIFPIGGPATFEAPSLEFFAGLPTVVDQLNAYFRKNVEGSSSRDEAVFVAVGDALQTADGLASPKLRAAMVSVLSLTPGVTIHQGVTDYLGRPALRADFVDQRIRPGEIESLYFDPTTFQLLESRDGNNGQPSSYNGPSPAYGAPAPSSADDPDVLGGAAYVDVMQSETVLDAMPNPPAGCVTS